MIGVALKFRYVWNPDKIHPCLARLLFRVPPMESELGINTHHQRQPTQNGRRPRTCYTNQMWERKIRAEDSMKVWNFVFLFATE